MTTVRRPELVAFALSALAIVAYVVLAIARQPQPGWLEAIAVGGLAGGSGLATPAQPQLGHDVAQLSTLLDQHAQAHLAQTHPDAQQ